MSDTVKPGQRCPKCGWHITPMNMKYHPGIFVTETEKANGKIPKDFKWVNCTEPEPNTEYLAKYKYDKSKGVWINA